MKRLVYCPKAYVFIRSANMGGKIYDLSTDIVSGSVTRNMNDLSTAEVVLRNRYKKWLRDPVTHQSIFLPMDMITIFLQRIAGHPIQVFTGYLDSVPYYQAYPGNCTIKASCTLKRLAYTWFDPGLDFFASWIRHMDGWTYDPTTGEAKNPNYIYKTDIIAPGDPAFEAGATSTMHDGGFAQLLNDFMTLIAGWEQQDVIVADLPPHLPKIAARLYTDINNRTNVALKALEDQMAQIMGMGLTVDFSQPSSATVPPTALATINTIKKYASNIPPLVLVFAGLLQTNFQANYHRDQSDGNDVWGYGIYKLRPDTVVDATGGAVASTDLNLGLTFNNGQIDGHDPKDVLDVATATQVMVKKLNDPKAQGSWVALARKGDQNAMVDWISKALGYKISSKSAATVFAAAKTYVGATTATAVTPTVTTNSDPADADFASLSLPTNETNILNKYYVKTQAKAPWLAWIVSTAKSISANIQVSPPTQHNAPVEAIYLTGPAPDLQKLFDTLRGTSVIDEVDATIGHKLVGLIKGVQTTNVQDTSLPNNTMKVFWSSTPAKLVVKTTSTTTDPTSGTPISKLTFENLAAFSANAAFAAQFSFPVNYLESHNLTGNKALMNDTSCLDAVKQFCQASMRNFMSLPDGRFVAFYPDYFGTVRGPYWNINDIEITNLGIQLNDEALATHVYVVGDTFALDGSVDWMDEVSTRGVATITQAMMLESFVEAYKVDKKGDIVTQKMGDLLHDAYSFLNHYGARPHKEENPLIRNAFYEFLLAWQRFMQLWAAQFATEVSFTFQPEIFAGGIIGFPDHGFQMYCESVTHSFDYEGGFSTTATLAAPAALHGGQIPPDKWRKPGFALAGNVNTVGA